MIDSHIHLWDAELVASADWLTGALARPFTLDDFDRVRGGLDAAVVVTAEQSERETRRLLALCRDRVSVCGVVGWADVSVPGVEERLASLRDLPGGGKLAGIRHSVISEAPGWLDGATGGIAEYARTGLPLEVLVSPDQLPDVVRLAQRFPELTIIVDHLGNPPEAGVGDGWDAWVSMLGRLAAFPNVVAKLSGLHGRRDPVEVALELVGADRLMFGSDWPVSSTHAAYADEVAWARAVVPESDHDAIFGGTAARVYGVAA